MRSAIWKLSALATVIGLGLVAVVMQQKGLGLSAGKPGDKAVASTTNGATAPKTAPAPAAAPDPKAPAKDPFSGDTDEPTLDATSLPPEEPQAPNEGAEQPPAQLAASAAEQSDEEAFTRPGTKPRIKPRGLNFKDNVEGEDPSGVEVAQVPDQTDTNRRTGGRLAQGRNPDPSEMEGPASPDRDSSSLTDESDPYEKHRRSKAQGTGNRSRTNVNNDPDAQSNQDVGNRGQGPENPFDRGAERDEQSGPIVPLPAKSNGRPHGKLIGESDAAEAEPVGSSDSTVADSAFEPTEASPAGYRAENGTTSPRAKSSAKPRPVLADDDDPKGTAGAAPLPPAATTPAPPPPAAKAGTGGNTGKRPNLLTDDDLDAAPARSSAPQPKGVETIPKKTGDPSTETDFTMPPPAGSKSGRVRPNPFAEEGDGDTGLGGRPGTPPKGQDRIETNPRGPAVPAVEPGAEYPKDNLGRPSKHILDVEPDDRPAQSGTPEAAASRSSDTRIVAPPARISTPPNYPTQVGSAAGGRGRVTIEKLAPQTAYVGQPLIYQIFVRNQGTGPAQQVIVEDLLPEGVTIQGSIPQGELTGRKLSWRVGTLAAREERKISVKVIPGAAGAIGSAATVKFIADQMFAAADAPDPAGTFQTGTTARTTPRTNSLTTARTNSLTSPRTNGGLQLDMQGPQQVAMGQPFEVRFRVTNRSGQPLNDLMVRNMLPNSLQHESRVQDLEYRVGTLAAGESRDMPLTLVASQPGRAVSKLIVMTANEQVLRSDEFTVEVAGNQLAQSGQGLPPSGQAQGTPNLAVDVVSPSGTVQVGGRAVYEIRLTSRGTAPVRQAAIQLTVPAELKLVDAGPLNYRQVGSDIVFDAIPTLEPGQQAILKAEFIAQTAGETFVKVQFVGAHMKRPLSREEGLQIGGQ